MNFEEFCLAPELLRAIKEVGYSKATPIQEAAIPIALAGRDITGIAQTGTGKTAAFVLPMIDKLSRGRTRARMPRSLVLEPTRELAAQVSESFSRYGAHYRLNKVLLIGGVAFGEQDQGLKRGADVLIATPGRLIDMLERGKVLLTGIEMLVVDEADRMLDMGFIPDIEKICRLLPKKRQSLLFSATMPPEIARLAGQFQSDPHLIEIDRPSTAATTITQYAVHADSDDKNERKDILRQILSASQVTNGIVFCNRKREVDMVADSLRKHGLNASAIHGDMPQSARTKTMDQFRKGELSLLIASDVAARGLDIAEVSHVFNFAPPPNPDDYIHRIGRTGRAGRKGQSYTIIAPEDAKNWQAVIDKINPDISIWNAEKTATPQSKNSSPQSKKIRKNSNKPQKPDNMAADSAPVRGLGSHIPDFFTTPLSFSQEKTARQQ